ncbi:transcriptional regulator [Sulfodiicoccus acidiphilus]|uniref:Transcriptional regulator n=1 Tax=Sulfodiicoccus acidiphilus TaxID=1670455 RepID=A0A348B760_9CREN|nr:helix-turn-helix domain-containing protein [Sulfodiicoccus acidiphilus]BBD74012.1 transcriptional regulator [Sulfodiicoccus acidiphilus]GGT87172.1 transcriptional regulator [Sulfodiicoccus acidiphilus]
MGEEVINEILGRVSRFASFMGVSRGELRAYTSLLINGKMSARELSDNLGISYTKIYSLLNKLEMRGWIRKVESKPNRYEAVSVREVWAKIKGSLTDRLNQFEKEFIDPLSSVLAAPSYTVSTISGGKVMEVLTQLLYTPSNRYLIAFSSNRVINDEVVKGVVNASYRGETKVIVTKDVSADRLKGVNVRVMDSMFGSGVITRGTILLMIESSPTVLGIMSSHQYLVEIGTVYFEYLWSRASEVRSSS